MESKLKDPNGNVRKALPVMFSIILFINRTANRLVFLLLIFVVSAFETLAMTVDNYCSGYCRSFTGIIMLQVGDKLGFRVANTSQQNYAGWFLYQF